MVRCTEFRLECSLAFKGVLKIALKQILSDLVVIEELELVVVFYSILIHFLLRKGPGDQPLALPPLEVFPCLSMARVKFTLPELA